MITSIEKVKSSLHSEIVLEKAAQILRNGGLVAFPTETVYGLGASAYHKGAARKVYEAKGRPSDNPLIVHIDSFDMIFQVAKNIPVTAKVLSDSFWPGPLTIIVEKGEQIPYEVTGGLNTVAVRLPDNKTARALIRKCGFPLVGPSANSSGKPSPTKASHVAFDLSGKIDMIIDGGICEIGLESTIVDITGEFPTILRTGSITEEEIIAAIKSHVKSRQEAGENEAPRAPGMKYIHYSPKAEITVVKGEAEGVIKKINELAEADCAGGKKIGVLATEETKDFYKNALVISIGSRDNIKELARNLYAVLRAFDYNEIDLIYSEGFDEEGIGKALMNRLMKAAGNREITI